MMYATYKNRREYIKRRNAIRRAKRQIQPEMIIFVAVAAVFIMAAAANGFAF